MFVLNAKLCSIYALILVVFGGLNWLLYLFFFRFSLLKKYGLIFKSPVVTTPRPPEAYTMCSEQAML